ncbi:MAG: ATP-binding cassette domain-containing protein [Rickettsiales bacterium]|jgi:iron complex transport system ATP-binding protein|nr:ATP-binding cassette domain-containing protein [Rickettsiales bacterium]
MNIIDFFNISICREERMIMKNFTLQVKEGENVAILGPNGSGKSTFINLITKDIYPSFNKEKSYCKIFDKDNWNLNDLRKNLGIVTTELQNKFKEITGLNMIITGYFGSYRLFENFKITKKMITHAKELADFMEISELNHKLVETMSSGEQRRFLIARALINDPKALILDEPTNSLDVKAIQNLKNTMTKITKQGKSLILVTHTVSDIIPEISKVVMIKKGEVFVAGKKNIVLTKKNLQKLFEMDLELVKDENNYTICF